MSQRTPETPARPIGVPTPPPPPPPPQPVAPAFGPPTYFLPPQNLAEPEVGAAAGALRVTEATPYSLELRGRNLMAILLAVGGLALSATFASILVLQVVHLVNGQEFTIHWIIFVFMVIGASAVWAGLSRVGLSYRFDGRARTLHRQMLFGRIGAKTWRASEIHQVRLRVASGKEDAWSGRERLIVTMDGPDGKTLTLDPIFGSPPTQSRSAETAARAAIAGARLLQVPVLVEGIVVKGRNELAALLTPQS